MCTVADVTDTTFLLKQQAPVATFLLFLNLPSLFCARRCFSAPHHDDNESLLQAGRRLSRYQVPDSHSAPRDQTLHIEEGLRLVSEQPERHQ